jgi:hypothetical protein
MSEACGDWFVVKQITGCWVVVLLSVATCTSMADERVRLLEGLVRQWVELNGEVASEVRDWEQQREWMETRIAWLTKERDRLQARVEAARDVQESDQGEYEQVQQAVVVAQGQVAQLASMMEAAESSIQAWTDRVPEPLRAGLMAPLDRVLAAGGGEQGIAERAQAVVAFYAALEEIQGGVHVVHELIQADGGERREMSVLYLGLGRGYAVSANGRVAAVGTPEVHGWVWRSAPGLGQAIQRAIRLHHKEMPAGLISLPVGVGAAGERGGRHE